MKIRERIDILLVEISVPVLDESFSGYSYCVVYVVVPRISYDSFLE